jgi:two-component system, OmpR family, sensor kinase
MASASLSASHTAAAVPRAAAGSIRPLRRVDRSNAQVADLPLESEEVSLPAAVPNTDTATETGQMGLAFNRMLGHVERTATARRERAGCAVSPPTPATSCALPWRPAAARGTRSLRPGGLPEEVTHALGQVLSESRRMSVLVDDLLLARFDADRPLSREPVDMTTQAIDATSDAQAARRRPRRVLELPDDPLLTLGDEGRLCQVPGNLVSNAGRHTPDGTTVTARGQRHPARGRAGTGPRSIAHSTLASGSGTMSVSSAAGNRSSVVPTDLCRCCTAVADLPRSTLLEWRGGRSSAGATSSPGWLPP